MSTPPLVTVEQGKLQGVYQDSGKIAVFKGIPYAEPPVGRLRWRPPQPARPWDGVRDASKFSPQAMQLMANFEEFMSNLINGQGWSWLRSIALKSLFKLVPHPKQSEDCLYLNVRTPKLDVQAKLPVMVWIHGGDHQDGSGSDVFYDSNLLAHRDVVVVSINYRLGVMGYLAHPELAEESAENTSGNYGTLDQIAALKWVQENIQAFGGDPNNVTIFGESAGGESVIHMMSSPLARGLFHKAIAQSPANAGQMVHRTRPFLDFDSAENMGVRFAAEFGIEGDNQLERLRGMAAEELYAKARILGEIGTHYPCIDEYVLPKSPFDVFHAGEQADVPLLIGSNADEGTLIYPIFSTLVSEYSLRDQPVDRLPAYMHEAFGEDVDALLSLYPRLATDQKARIDFCGDYMFGARAYLYAEQAAEAGQDTFLYMFARTPDSPKQTAGAYHAAELSFVHGGKVPILPMTTADDVLSEQMMAYWTQFAKTGDPNGMGNPEWPLFSAADPQWQVLNHQITTERVSRKAQYDVFNAHTERLVDKMRNLRVVMP